MSGRGAHGGARRPAIRGFDLVSSGARARGVRGPVHSQMRERQLRAFALAALLARTAADRRQRRSPEGALGFSAVGLLRRRRSTAAALEGGVRPRLALLPVGERDALERGASALTRASFRAQRRRPYARRDEQPERDEQVQDAEQGVHGVIVLCQSNLSHASGARRAPEA